MRQITITFTEVPEREETETWADFGDAKAATEMENMRVNFLFPLILAILKLGCQGIAVDATGKSQEELRREARIGSDIVRKGEAGK